TITVFDLRHSIGLSFVLAMAVLLSACASGAVHSSSPTAPLQQGDTTPERPAVEQTVEPQQGPVALRFRRWVAAFRARAAADGVSPATLDAAFANVALVPRILELDN